MDTNDEVINMVEKFHGMLNHVRDTFINASTLAETVKTLQEQVNKLQSDVQHYSNQITVLDEALTNRTRERDEAQQALAQERADHNRLAQEHSNLKSEHQQLWDEHNSASNDLYTTKRERDDALGEARRLGEENEALKRRIEAIQNLLTPNRPEEQPRDEVGRFASGASW